MEVLSPFVYWGQNSERISLKVDLREIKNVPEIKLDEDELHFKAVGVGVRGEHNYEFCIQFYLPIEAENSKFKVTDLGVEFQIRKKGAGEVWPRLTFQRQKTPWLKVDFDNFAYGDDSDVEPETNSAEMDKFMSDKLLNELGEPEPEFSWQDLKTAYLFLYNLFQWVGYTVIFLWICIRYMKDGTASIPGTYDTVAGQLMICQLAACLEFIHPMLGLVRTGVIPPLMQVLGRNVGLFMIIAQDKRMHDNVLVWYLFLIWTAVEVFRYPFYILSSLNMDVKIVTWLRYTVWIPLYPAGFLVEVFIMLTARPYYVETGKWTKTLPNAWNISFDFPTFIYAYLALFIPATIIMLKHMYAQRIKKLNPKKAKVQ